MSLRATYATSPDRGAINELKSRIETLEAQVFRTARKATTTRAQQMLLLLHLGILEKLNELPVSKKKKAKLLSVLLNASEDNIYEDLSEVFIKKSSLNTAHNLKFLHQTFQDAGLKELAKEIDIQLDKLGA